MENPGYSQSPDLHLTEMVWDELKQSVHVKKLLLKHLAAERKTFLTLMSKTGEWLQEVTLTKTSNSGGVS